MSAWGVAVGIAHAGGLALPPELPTRWQPPPGNALEHMTAGFAKILCSALFITGRDLATAIDEDGFFVSPRVERRSVTKVVVDPQARAVHLTDDIEKFCKVTKPGVGRILNCLKSHETELSESCRGKIGELQGIIKGSEQACSGDIAQFCKEVQPGGGRILKCLREHDKELSSSCSEKLEMISKRLQRKGE